MLHLYLATRLRDITTFPVYVIEKSFIFDNKVCEDEGGRKFSQAECAFHM